MFKLSKNSITWGSLGIVFFLYLVYGWVVVPLLLPPRTLADMRSGGAIGGFTFETALRDEYSALFPEGAWERTSPKLMQFGRIVVLFQERDDSVKDVIKISPCTIIQLPCDAEELATDAGRDLLRRKAIVMQTREYALLEFTGSLDIMAANSLRLKQGRLFGAITIFSEGDSPVADDNLCITCRDITFTDSPSVTTITTISDVDFQLGANCGRGSMLTIEFASPDAKNLAAPKSLAKIEFEKLKYLDLATDALPKNGDAPSATPSAPLEVRCNGMFRFIPDTHNAEHWIAEFNDSVRVSRPNSDGTIDQLESQALWVYFAPQIDDNKNAAQKLETQKLTKDDSPLAMQPLTVARLLAVGQPAIISAPSCENLVARGERLGYDLVNRKIMLEKSDLASPTTVSIAMRGGDDYIEGGRIHYAANADGDLVTLAVSGAGKLRHALKRGETPLQLAWKKQLVAHPNPADAERVIFSVDDQVELTMESLGRLRADGIQLDCRRVKSSSTKSDSPLGGIALAPLAARATGNVQLMSMFGTCLVKQLECHFQNLTQDAAQTSTAQISSATRTTLPPELARRAPRNPFQNPLQNSLQTRAPQNSFVEQVQYTEKLTPITNSNSAPSPTSHGAAVLPAVGNNISSSAISPGRVSSALENSAQINSANSATPFDVSAEQMKVLVVSAPDATRQDISCQEISHIDQLWLAGNVRVIERISSPAFNVANAANSPLAAPIEITGREIHIWNPETPATEIQVIGEPNKMATFRGKGMTLTTTNLSVSRANNTLWSEGIGRLMAIPSAVSFSDSALAPLASDAFAPQNNFQNNAQNTSPQNPLVIDWNRGMSFNGQEVLFEGDENTNAGNNTTENGVRVFYQHKQIHARHLVVRLASFFSLFERSTAESAQIETIECRGNVFVQNIQYVGSTMTSRDQARFGKEVILTFHLPSGQLTANGYGRFQSTFLGKQFSVPDLSSNRAATPMAMAAKESENGLGYIDVTFHETLDGNLYRRNVILTGQVDCKYTPVNTWDELRDTADPAAFVKRGLLLTCGRLQVASAAATTSNSEANDLEFRAEDKATIEGRGGQYTGTAESIQYSQAKDLLVMSGSGLANALLWQCDRPGDIPQKIELKRIEYHPRANILRASGLQHGMLTTQ